MRTVQTDLPLQFPPLWARVTEQIGFWPSQIGGYWWTNRVLLEWFPEKPENGLADTRVRHIVNTVAAARSVPLPEEPVRKSDPAGRRWLYLVSGREVWLDGKFVQYLKSRGYALHVVVTGGKTAVVGMDRDRRLRAIVAPLGEPRR